LATRGIQEKIRPNHNMSKVDEGITDQSSSAPSVNVAKTDENTKLLKSVTIDATATTTTRSKAKSKSNGKKGRRRGRHPQLSCRSLIFALAVRIMFSLHAAIAFWRVTVISENLEKMGMEPWQKYCNLAGIGLLFMETFITLLYRGGKDYKWFCPCVFFYLISIIPSMIMIEYNSYLSDCSSDRDTRSVDYFRFRRDANFTNLNATNISLSLVTDQTDLNTTLSGGYATTEMSLKTATTVTTPIPVEHQFDDGDKIINELWGGVKNTGSDIAEKGSEAIDLVLDSAESLLGNDDNWQLGLHQVLLFFLVIGRWLLPRGGISREQLSQLLLVFIGTGADILEFVSETIEDDMEEKCAPTLRYMIWSVWAWSLLQFNLVLTASTSRKNNVATTAANTKTDFKNKRILCSCCHGYFSNPDVWGMLMTLILQDLPFFFARSYFIFHLGIRSQMMIFFTVKNLLVVFLQFYRLAVLWSAK